MKKRTVVFLDSTKTSPAEAMSNRPCSSKIVNTTEIALVAPEITSTLPADYDNAKKNPLAAGIIFSHGGVLGNTNRFTLSCLHASSVLYS